MHFMGNTSHMIVGEAAELDGFLTLLHVAC
jgi:hypothetical protein